MKRQRHKSNHHARRGSENPIPERKSVSWLLKNGRRSFPSIILLTLLAVVLSLLQLKFVTASKNVINIATNQTQGVFSTACIWLFSLIIIRLVLQIATNFLKVHASSKFEIELKRHVFQGLINKDYLMVSKYHSGELLNRINSDISTIVNGVISLLPSLALFLTSIIGGFIMLSSINSNLAYIILAVGPLVAIGARLYSKRYKVLHKKCQEADGKTKSFMLEILQNLLVVKSFNSEVQVLDKAEELQMKSYRLRVYRVLVSIVAHIGMFLIFNAGYYFALAYSAYLLSLALLTYGDVIAILQLVDQIQTPFKNISSLFPQFFALLASTERLIELEQLPDDKNTGDFIPDDCYDRLESIIFDNVTFAYSDSTVVSGIDMKIDKGETVVVAGESGAGKSTAIKLLLGIMTPKTGRIIVRTSLRDYEIGKNSRKLFSYVPQGNLILSGTIRENISFSRPDATEEEIINAAKIAQIWDYIETLEDGLDTVLGEKGLGLSEGQVQRISIARAILYDAPILLLDESTSALDSQTELALLDAVKKMTDKTCIIVSHKQAAFDICDKVCYVTKAAERDMYK